MRGVARLFGFRVRGGAKGPRGRALEGARARLLAGALLAPIAACEDLSYREIGSEIRILVTRDDAYVAPAALRLAGFGRRAVPQVETALHTASKSGRLHLVDALDRIGDAEAVPILRHFAVYDAEAEVRSACEALLRRWAMAGGARGERARHALGRMAERRARGEGPIVVE